LSENRKSPKQASQYPGTPDQLFELWLSNAVDLNRKMKDADADLFSERDFFLSEILSQKIENFTLDDLLRNKHGKPVLQNSPLSFNLSHCGEHFALVLCDQKLCGIDIQTAGSREKYSDALQSVLTDREYSILSEIGKNDEFFQLWSLKEAYIKALGSSIWHGRDYDFSTIIPDYSDRWIYINNLYIYSTEISDRLFLSVAVSSEPDKIDFRKM